MSIAIDKISVAILNMEEPVSSSLAARFPVGSGWPFILESCMWSPGCDNGLRLWEVILVVIDKSRTWRPPLHRSPSLFTGGPQTAHLSLPGLAHLIFDVPFKREVKLLAEVFQSPLFGNPAVLYRAVNGSLSFLFQTRAVFSEEKGIFLMA